MKAVLLCGGLGTRISEESHLKPKPMIEVGGRPILWHIMKLFSHHGFNEFVVCLGYKGYVIKEYFANYVLHNADLTVDLAGEILADSISPTKPRQITASFIIDRTAEMFGLEVEQLAQGRHVAHRAAARVAVIERWSWAGVSRRLLEPFV